jgi:hypothetical protein
MLVMVDGIVKVEWPADPGGRLCLTASVDYVIVLHVIIGTRGSRAETRMIVDMA